jgi:hypothetical protein
MTRTTTPADLDALFERQRAQIAEWERLDSATLARMLVASHDLTKTLDREKARLMSDYITEVRKVERLTAALQEIANETPSGCSEDETGALGDCYRCETMIDAARAALAAAGEGPQSQKERE